MWYKYTTRFSVHYNGNMFGSIVQKKLVKLKPRYRGSVSTCYYVFSVLCFFKGNILLKYANRNV
jgi:hypothetical protein